MTKNRATIALAAVLFPLAAVAGFTADSWNPYSKVPTTTPAPVIQVIDAVDDAATPDPLPPCEVEDGSSGPIPCRWDAQKSGNGKGRSFTILDAHTWVYDNGEVAHD